MYELEGTPADMRRQMLLQFRKNSIVVDPRMVELSLVKAEMELEETVNQWKQRSMVQALLDPEPPSRHPLLHRQEMFSQFFDGSLSLEDLWGGRSRKGAARLLAAVGEGAGEGEVSPAQLKVWADPHRERE